MKEIILYVKPDVVLWYNPKTDKFEDFGQDTMKQVFNVCESLGLTPVFL